MSKSPPTIRDSQPVHVVDAGDLRKYRTELPNLIDDLDLSIFAYRLYGHLKRRAGADGTTIEGLRSMARHCKMAVGTAAKARRELLDRELITTEEVVNDKGRFERITIVDLWERNFLHYAEMRRRKSKPLSDGVYHQTIHPPVSPGDTPGVPSDEQGVSRDSTPPVSPGGTLKKEPGEEITNEERTTHSPPTPSLTPTAAGGSGSAGVGVSKSKFSPEIRRQYMAGNSDHQGNPLGEGWFIKSADGRYDESIESWLDKRRRAKEREVAEREKSKSDAELTEIAEALVTYASVHPDVPSKTLIAETQLSARDMMLLATRVEELTREKVESEQKREELSAR